MIEIHGFSAKQKVLADLVWTMGSKEAVERFISTLSPEDAREARVVVDMIVLEFTDTVAEIQQETIDLIDRFRL
jgi:hypothetical protein